MALTLRCSRDALLREANGLGDDEDELHFPLDFPLSSHRYRTAHHSRHSLAALLQCMFETTRMSGVYGLSTERDLPVEHCSFSPSAGESAQTNWEDFLDGDKAQFASSDLIERFASGEGCEEDDEENYDDLEDGFRLSSADEHALHAAEVYESCHPHIYAARAARKSKLKKFKLTRCHVMDKKAEKRVLHVVSAANARKSKVDGRLRKLGVSRRGPIDYVGWRTVPLASSYRHVDPARIRRSAFESSASNRTWVEDDELNRKLATEINAVAECGLTYDLILALSTRELTPEDYDLLLRLDEVLPKKTLSATMVDSFPSLSVGVDYTCDGEERCIICMCEYEEGDVLSRLPCDHVYHRDCISSWLTSSSITCPLDGLPLD